jgi:Phage integrase family/Arm DNA-binding domain
MPQAKLTPAFVAKANFEQQANADRVIYWDESLPGFGLMLTANGHRSYVVQYRANGASRRMTIKGNLPLSVARKQAKALQGDVAKGKDPLGEKRKAHEAEANSLRSIAEEYLKREGKKLRTIKERRAEFRRYIYPRLGARPIDGIRRSEIVRLLDKVEDKNGPGAAQKALVALSRLFNWYASRSDDFRSPIVRGMARINPKERARDRWLSDDELRTVWRTAEHSGNVYGHLLRFILLTATRRREASNMNRSELSAHGSEWTIPAARYKTKLDHLIPLSKFAQAVLAEVPIIGTKGWVFTTDGTVPISGFSKFKKAFDAKVLAELRKHDPEAKPLPTWTTHDLRRTARSLMSRAGVPSDHVERALGHVIGGVRGVYDRYEYHKEKRAAFEALALQVERILHPHENVVALKQTR